MADRYWVGGTDNWTSTAGTKWATTSGGAGGAAVPTSADDVFFDAASGAGITQCTIVASCRSLNFTGYTGTFNLSTSSNVQIGTSTVHASNIALKLVAGMTFAASPSSTFTFVSTNATQQTIDTAGKSVASIACNGVGGSWILSGALTCTATLTLSAGTLDTNSQTVTCATFTGSTVSAKTLTLGSSAINVTGTATASLTLPAACTYTANTATFTLSGNGGGANILADLNGASLAFTYVGGNNHLNASSGVVKDLTRTGGASKTSTLQVLGNITVTGTLALNGNSATNRLLVASNTIGTARTITAATVSCSNVDFQDITGAGAASWDLSAITGNSGDCGGNTNITFTSATTQTATGTASFTWSTHGWTSRVPLPQDTAVISNAFVSTRIVTFDMPRVGSVDFTGSTGNVSLVSTSTQVAFYGHLTLRSGMGNCAFNSLAHASFIGASQQNLTMAGNANNSPYNIYIDRSKLQLQDDYLAPTNVFTNGIVTRNSGFIDTQGFDVRCAYFWAQNTSNVNLLSTSTFTLMYTTTGSVGTILDFGVATAARVSAANADFVIEVAATGPRIVGLAGVAISSLTYTVANSPGILTVTGGGTIGTLNLGSARTVTQTSGTTLNIGTTINATGVPSTAGLVLNGTAGNYASSPDSSALDITGDITLVVQATMTDWTPSTFSSLVGKWSNVSGSRAYVLAINSVTGVPILYWSTDGITTGTIASTVATGFADGSIGYLAVTFDVDNGASGRSARFWISTDGVTWSQLGTTVTAVGTTTIGTTAVGLTIGSDTAGASNMVNGTIHSVQVWDGIRDLNANTGGTLAFDADFTTKPFGADSFTESSSNAATVTINGAAAQASDGAVRFRSSTPGSAATISKASGTIQVTSASIKDSTATGGATWNAVDSYSVSGNTGWNFITSWIPKIINFFTG